MYVLTLMFKNLYRHKFVIKFVPGFMYSKTVDSDVKFTLLYKYQVFKSILHIGHRRITWKNDFDILYLYGIFN